jgi:hypothetical protein
MEEFFDILKTQSSLPSGNIRMPDIPPSLEGKLPGATAAAFTTAAAADAAAPSHEKLLVTHSSNGTSSNGSNAAGGWAGSNGSSIGSSLDQQDLVEAALLLEEQQHPQHKQQHLQQQQLHNLGSSSSLDVGMPDRSVAISGLGLEVDLEDVRFGYQPERQVSVAVARHVVQFCVGGCWLASMPAAGCASSMRE